MGSIDARIATRTARGNPRKRNCQDEIPRIVNSPLGAGEGDPGRVKMHLHPTLRFLPCFYEFPGASKTAFDRHVESCLDLVEQCLWSRNCLPTIPRVKQHLFLSIINRGGG